MTEISDIAEQLSRLGKGLVQLNVRVTQLLENGSRLPTTPDIDGRELEILFDLLDGVGAAIERKGPAVAASKGLLARFRRRDDAGDDLWRGISMARESALERLRTLGVQPIPASGSFDPELHCAVETRTAPSPELAGTVAGIHRAGWVLQSGSGRKVLRTAQVTVYEIRNTAR